MYIMYKPANGALAYFVKHTHGSRFYMIILGVSIMCLQSSKSHLPKIVGTEFFWKIKAPVAADTLVTRLAAVEAL